MPAILACPACRTGQLSRRGDPLCPACTQAAQKTVFWPLWLFDSPLLRRALAQLNVPAVPAIVRAACGLSQRDLAGIVGWSPAALSYYERGQRDAVFDIRAVLQFADALGMPRAALLPLILADPDAGLAPGAGSGTGMDVDGVVSVAWPLALRLLSSCPPPAPRPGSAVPICGTGRRVRTRCTSGTAWSAGRPCSALRQWQWVRQAVKVPGNASQAGCQLRGTAGDLALCRGWIALDGGNLPLARSLYGEARQLAEILAAHCRRARGLTVFARGGTLAVGRPVT